MGINDGLVEHIAAGIEHGDLTAGSEPWIDRHHDLLGDWWLQQQPAQILGEDFDGVFLGGFGQIAANLAFHARQDQTVEGVERRCAEELGVGMAVQRKLTDKHSFEIGPRYIESDLERTFLVATIDRQNSMRRDLRDRLGVVKIVPILEPLPLGNFGLAGDDLAGLPDDLADGIAHRGHLADGFREDVADPFEHLLDRFEALFGVDEFLCRRRQVGQGLVAGPDPEGERFQPAIPRIGCLGSFFWLEWKVEVFEPLGIVGRSNGGRQVGIEFPLGLDRLQNGLFAVGQLAQTLHAKLDFADHHFVQVAGAFLAVACDERDGVALVQKLDDALHLHPPDLQVLRNTPQVDLNRVVHGDSTLHQVRL